MNIITFQVTNEEKAVIQALADLNGLSLSEFAKTKLLERLEDQVDMALYEQAIKSHELNDESISHQELLLELGLV